MADMSAKGYQKNSPNLIGGHRDHGRFTRISSSKRDRDRVEQHGAMSWAHDKNDDLSESIRRIKTHATLLLHNHYTDHHRIGLHNDG
jgi:hypothetical protein